MEKSYSKAGVGDTETLWFFDGKRGIDMSPAIAAEQRRMNLERISNSRARSAVDGIGSRKQRSMKPRTT
jgi:hypothetical protein